MESRRTTYTEFLTDPQALDDLQSGLEACGFAGPVGPFCDGANAVVSAVRGDWTGAAASGAAIFPLVGDGVAGARLAAKGYDGSKSADDFVGPLSKTEFDGLQKSLEPNKLNHLFAKQQHGLDGLVQRYGGQEAVVEQMYRGLSSVTPSDGLFSVTRRIGGQAVTIDGRVVNGIPRIGTAYIKP